MKVGRSPRPSFFASCRIADMKGSTRAFSIWGLVAGALIVFHCAAFAAGPVRAPAADGNSQKTPNSYAPIGDSGYRVPIPEIKMNRIFGGPQEQPPGTEEPKRDAVRPPSERTQTPAGEAGGTREGPRVQWLPFDPTRRTPTLRPPHQREPREEPKPKDEIPSVLKSPPAPDEPLEAIPPKKDVLGSRPVPQLPVVLALPRAKESPQAKYMKFRDARELTGTLASIPLDTRQKPVIVAMPEPKAAPVPRPQRVAVPEPQGDLALHQAPDVLAAHRVGESSMSKQQGFHDVGAPPGPLTSIPLGTRHEPSTVAVPKPAPVPSLQRVPVPEPQGNLALRQPPDVLPVPRVKESPGSKQQGFHDAAEPAGPLASIPLGTRREPEQTVIPEPEPKPEPAVVPQPGSKPEPAPVAEPAPEQPVPESPVTKGTAPAQPSEPIEMKPPVQESSSPKEQPAEQAKEQPITPAKEALPSPLDDEGTQSVELRHYLRDTAPILEELSLLMTRAPSLALADYDPSQEHPTAFRDDVYMKIEYMKRELQVLDSKTFAIMPPKKYSAFHSVIRDSITETYQACDTIMTYMRDPTGQNLQKMQDHLRRARELILRTRTNRG